jgi:hypothetical protein
MQPYISYIGPLCPEVINFIQWEYTVNGIAPSQRAVSAFMARRPSRLKRIVSFFWPLYSVATWPHVAAMEARAVDAWRTRGQI